MSPVTSTPFIATRRHLSARHTINAPVDQVFPLLCPVREFDWIEKWHCEMIYADSGLAELGAVFATDTTAEGGGQDVWVISQYQRNRHIQFIRVNQLRTIRYDLHIEADTDKTHILWEQQLTALNPAGNTFLAQIKSENFNAQIALLETLLNHYLQTGQAKPMD